MLTLTFGAVAVSPVTPASAQLTGCTLTINRTGSPDSVTARCTSFNGAPGSVRAVAKCDSGGYGTNIVYRYGPWVGLGAYSHAFCPSTSTFARSDSFYQLS